MSCEYCTTNKLTLTIHVLPNFFILRPCSTVQNQDTGCEGVDHVYVCVWVSIRIKFLETNRLRYFLLESMSSHDFHRSDDTTDVRTFVFLTDFYWFVLDADMIFM